MTERGARDEVNAALSAAAQLGHKDIVGLLLKVDEHSVSKEAIMERFTTAFSNAAEETQPSMVEYLCAVLDQQVQDNTTCLDAADCQQIRNEALNDAVRCIFWERIPQAELADNIPAEQQQANLAEGGDGVHQGEGGPQPPEEGIQGQEGAGPAGGIPNQHPALQTAHILDHRTRRVLPASQGHISIVQHLLQQGADPNHRNGLVLAQAVTRQYEEDMFPCQDHAILQLLLDAGGNNVDEALVAAVHYGDAAVVPKLLAAAQGPVDPQGGTLLEAALGHSGIVDCLLRGGANVAAALRTAAANGCSQAAVVLLQHPSVRVSDQELKQQLVDLAARRQSFQLMWALSKAVGMLDDCKVK
jgi:hypothetical protein